MSIQQEGERRFIVIRADVKPTLQKVPFVVPDFFKMFARNGDWNEIARQEGLMTKEESLILRRLLKSQGNTKYKNSFVLDIREASARSQSS